MKRYYGAYGSNLNMQQMKRRCPGAKVLGQCNLEGYRLMFKGSKTGSYLTVEKAKGHKVPLGLWEVTEADELNLDRYEGYPSFYYKKEIETSLGIVFIYIMHEDRKLGFPSLDYVNTCLQGYDDFGFDDRILLEALDFTFQNVGA